MSTNNNNTAPNNNGAVPNHQQNSFNQASTNQQPFVNAPTVFFQNVPSSVPLPNTTNPAVPQFESVVDMENFAKFQQEQAKQFTLFQQQQAAVFLQIALQQQKQQLVEAIIQQPGMQHAFSGNTATIIPNTGLLYPGTNRSSSTSPANSFANMNLNEQPIVMNSGSLPMYIPNTHINPTNTLSGSNGSAMSDMSSSFGDKESAMTTSPPNSSNMGNTEYDAESNMGSERHQILMANQRRTGPVRRSKKGGWSEEEDEMLRLAVETYGGKNWKKIAETLQNRTSVQCLHRWQKVLNPNLVKGPWTKEEDDTILQLVKTYGAENWSMIASHLPGRIGKQCRERWYNHLDPNIKKEPWTEQEEKQLLEAQLKLGNKWAEISKIIPGRTDNACKNHYNSLVAREKKKTVIPKATPSTTTRKQKKPAKSPDSISKARHKRSLSDTVFYQNYQYESPHHHDGLLAPPVLSPMATSSSSNRSGNNSPIIFTNNSSANNQLPPPQPSLLSSLITPQFNFPFNQPMIIPNTNAVQQNFIPLHRPNVQKPATTNTTTDSNVKQGNVPSIAIIPSPTTAPNQRTLFQSSEEFDPSDEYPKLDEDNLINQVGSGYLDMELFNVNDVIIHDNSNPSNEDSNSIGSGKTKVRPSTVFNEDMDFNDFEESDLNSFLDDDSNNEQTNSGMLSSAFVELDNRQTKKKKFNHIFHNRSISFDVSQLQNKDFFFN